MYLSDNQKRAIILYKQETDCKYCKYCVKPYMFPWSYTCRLNDRTYIVGYNDLRGMYSEGNPLLCKEGTERYVW